MQAFSSAIKGLFGYHQIPGAHPAAVQPEAGIGGDPPLDDVLGTEPEAAPEPDAVALAQAQVRLNEPVPGCPSLPSAASLKKLPQGLAGGLATAFTGATTMATVMMKQGSATPGTVVLASVAAAFGGFVAGGFIEMAYRASAADDAAQRQA